MKRSQKRWSDEELKTLWELYPEVNKEQIMRDIPNRSWKAICERAHAHGLHRSFAAKHEAIREGKRLG